MNVKVGGLRFPVVDNTFAFDFELPVGAKDPKKWLGLIQPSPFAPSRVLKVYPNENLGRFDVAAAVVGEAIVIAQNYQLRSGPQGGWKTHRARRYFVVRAAGATSVVLDEYDDAVTALLNSARAITVREGRADTFENYTERRKQLWIEYERARTVLWDVETMMFLGTLTDGVGPPDDFSADE